MTKLDWYKAATGIIGSVAGCAGFAFALAGDTRTGAYLLILSSVSLLLRIIAND